MDKQMIADQFKELELTCYGDFKVKSELIDKYEIIDFHCHLFDAVKSFVPKVFRRPINSSEASFFNLSCYPISTKDFNINSVLYTDYPKGTRGLLKIGYELSGLGGFIRALRSATPERLVHDMQLNNIYKAVVLQLNTPEEDCIDSMKAVVSEYDSLLTFGSIHPEEKNIKNKIDQNIKAGVLGWKIAPHVNGYDIDGKETMALLKHLNETNMPIISCSGLAIPQDKLPLVPKSLRKNIETQNMHKFKNVLSTYPDMKLVFGHGGIYQYKEVIELMKQYPSTYADISTQPSENIRELIKEVGSERLLYGTDYPAFNHAIVILSVLRATDNEDDRKNIFSNNAKRLLNI